MDCINCSICGDNLTDEGYKHTLKCGHSFHYECLLMSFKTMRNTSCPYCRSTNNTLPLVNGLKKLYPSIHDMHGWEQYENKKCLHIIERGKNKGKQCSRYCHIGMDYCLTHNKKHKELEIINNNNNNTIKNE